MTGELIYNMMKLYNPVTPDSLWPVWADTDMSEHVDILTLTPDNFVAGPGSYKWVIYKWYLRRSAHWVIQY